MPSALDQLIAAQPETAIILGSGLGAVAESFSPVLTVPYAEVPGLPVSKVPGHAGRFVLGTLPDSGRKVVVAQGRSHLYEGLSAAEVTAGVRFWLGSWGSKDWC